MSKVAQRPAAEQAVVLGRLAWDMVPFISLHLGSLPSPLPLEFSHLLHAVHLLCNHLLTAVPHGHTPRVLREP